MAVTTVPPSLTRAVETTPPGAIQVAVPRKPVVHWERHYVTLASVADAGVAYVAGTAAFLLLSSSVTPPSTYLLLTLLFPIAWVATIAMSGGYQRQHLSVGPEEFNRIAIASLSILAAVGTSSWLFGLDMSRGYVGVALAGATVGSLLGRYGLRKHVHLQRRLGHYQRRTLLVGSRHSVDQLAEHLDKYDYHGYGVVGTLTPAGETGSSKASAVTDALRSYRADTVAITADSHLDADELKHLAWQLEPLGISLFVAPSLMEVAGPRLSVHPVEGVSLLRIDQPTLTGVRHLLKETGDTVLALLGLVALAPHSARHRHHGASGQPRTGVLPTDEDRSLRRTLRDRQVPDDGGRRRGSSRRGRLAQRGRRAAVQGGRRPTSDPDRCVPPPDVTGRAAPAVERGSRRDVLGGPAPVPACRGGRGR